MEGDRRDAAGQVILDGSPGPMSGGMQVSVDTSESEQIDSFLKAPERARPADTLLRDMKFGL